MYLAIDNNLEILPVINKIDLPNARPDEVKKEIEDVIGIPAMDAPCISAKSGLNVEEVLERIVKDFPAPSGDIDAPLQALIFDSFYDNYKGAVAFVRVKDGSIKVGDSIEFMATGKSYVVSEVGYFGAGTYNPTQFDSITADIEAREISANDLSSSIDDGWRMVCSEMSEAINYVEANIVRNPKIDLLPNITDTYRKGQVGVNGGSDLMFFDSIPALYSKYQSKISLENGMRNAKCDDFVINHGDSQFLDRKSVV